MNRLFRHTWFPLVLQLLALAVFALVLMGIGILLSVTLTRKLIAVHATGSGGRALLLHLIPVVFGGGFGAMLIAWRLHLIAA